VSENEPSVEGAASQEKPSATVRWLTDIIQALLLICVVGWVLDLPRRLLNMSFYTEQMLAICLGLALALSLPASLPHANLLEIMAFGVVLFTLLGQGTTIQSLLRWLQLIKRSPHILDRERRMGQLYATQAGMRRLADLYHDGLLSKDIWAGLRTEYEHTGQQVAEKMTELFAEHADLEQEVLLQARQEALRAERVALGDALRRGLISEEVYQQLTNEVDRRLQAVTLIAEAVTPVTSAPEE